MKFSATFGGLTFCLLLTACLGEETPPENGGGDVDATVVPGDPDAEVVIDDPDAAPAPDAVPGAPDAEPPPPDAAPPAPVSFATDLMPILMSRCGGCHLKDTAGAGGLSFGVQGQLAYVAMLDQSTNNLDVDCSSLKLVDSSNLDPMQSSLYLKIEGDSCGARMPKGTNPTPLPAEQLELFARWIAEGAQNN